MKPFKIMQMKNNASAQVDIFDTSAIDFAIDPADALASYSLQSGGGGTRTNFAPWTWLLSGVNSDYQVRATVNSGTLTSGPVGSWDLLSTTRTWNCTQTSVGDATANLLIEIRRVSDSVVIDTATVDILASVS